MGFSYFDMEFINRFPYLKWNFPHKFRAIFAYFRDFRGLEMGFPALEMNLCGKFKIRKSSNKFHIKVGKPLSKLQTALFKRGSERNCKNKNVLEFDVEKDGGIIF